jgi:hypothetical protein
MRYGLALQLSRRQVSLVTLVAAWLGCSAPTYWVEPHGTAAEDDVGGSSATTSIGGRASTNKAGATSAGTTSTGGSRSAGATSTQLSGGAIGVAGYSVTEGGFGGFSGEPNPDEGGALGQGGTVAVGGAATIAGRPNAGVLMSSGGVSSSSDTTSTGGITSTGGAVGIAGSTNAGGVRSTGGTMGVAGATSKGGTKSAGGAPASGGTPSTGGAPARGGAPATGGLPATGGARHCAGTAVFCDDFESGTSQWDPIQGTWAVALDGSNVYGCTLGTNEARSIAGTATWTDYTVTAKIKLIQVGAGKRIYLAARVKDASNWYGAAFYNNGTPPTIQIRSKIAGTSATLASASFAWVQNQWYTVAFKLSGADLTLSIDRTVLLTAQDTSFAAGSIALLVDQSQIHVDDVTVTVP